MGRSVRVAFSRIVIAACLLVVFGAAGVWGEQFTYGESVSGQEAACGTGEWIAGDQRAFSHEIDYSITIDSDRGYVVDCYGGTDAYFEYSYTYYGGVYVYTVWGQLGGFS